MNAAGSDHGHTRLLAVLFVDQVGSTQLLRELGDLRADRVRTEVEALLDASVISNGGRVVKRTGDGVMAVFEGASLALDAAVAMQLAAGRRNARDEPDVQIELRVGISVGDVTVEVDDCHGLSVVESARLEQAAPTGGIYCSDMTKALAGNRTDAVFVEPVEVDAKGFDAPLSAWLVAPPSRDENLSFSLPESLGSGGRWEFVGREEEFEAARSAWKACCEQRATGLLLAGEPGAGKTRLARELGREVLDAGGRVMHGRCDEGIGVPFQPVVEMLKDYVATLDGAAHPSDFGASPGELLRLMPTLDQVVPGLQHPASTDAETERYRMYEAVESWLEVAAARTPVLVVIDDFHWAAPQTLHLLRHLLRRSSRSALCILATYRDTETDGSKELSKFFADVRRSQLVTTITLSGLTSDAISALVEPIIDDVGAELVDRIASQTSGNPFFVSEVLAAVAEQGVDALSDVNEGALGDVVMDRVTRLGPVAIDVLNNSAAASAAIELDVLARALAATRSELVPAIDETLRAGLLLESPDRPIQYRFHHALVRSTVYKSLSHLARAQMHERIALAIEAVHGHNLEGWFDDLAYHYLRAENPDLVDRAVEVCEQAGHEAAKALGFGLAIDHFTNALELLDAYGSSHPPELRGQLLLHLGLSRRRAGVGGARQAFLDAADEAARHHDVDTMVSAALLNSRGFFSVAGQTDRERVARLERAIDAVGSGDSPQRSRLMANLATELTFEPGAEQRRSALLGDSIEIAERLGDAAVLAHALHGRISSLWNADGLTERLALCDRLRQLAADEDLDQWKFNAAQAQFQASSEAGDIASVDRCLDEMLEMIASFRQPVLESYVRLREGTRRLIAGDLDEAERLAEECFELAKRSGQPDATAFYVGQITGLRYHQGRMHELADLLPELVANDGLPSARAATALMHCELGEPAVAAPIFQSVADSGDQLMVDLSWILTNALLAETCWQLGDVERAHALHGRLNPYRDQFVDNATVWLGSLQRPLGLLEDLLGRHADADVSLAAALQIHDQLPAPAMRARTQVDWATCVVGRGRTTTEAGDPVAPMLKAALVTAQELSLAQIEQQANHLLISLGDLESPTI